MIARWYWWRVTAWSEIVAIAVSLVVGNLAAYFLADPEGADYFGIRLLLTIGISTVAWVGVTLWVNKRPRPQALAFYREMRIAGPGWRRVSEETGVVPEEQSLVTSGAAWLLCCALMIAILVGTGKLLFHEWTAAGICVAVAGVSAFGLARVTRGFKMLR